MKVTIDFERLIAHKVRDDDPDLSWLYQSDEEMGEGFEARAKERMEAYDRGDWCMVGVYVRVFTAGSVMLRESSGLWGIESDSDPTYFDEVAREEAGELAISFGLDGQAFKDLPLEWSDDTDD